MAIQQYSVNQYPIQYVLTLVKGRTDSHSGNPAPLRMEC